MSAVVTVELLYEVTEAVERVCDEPGLAVMVVIDVDGVAIADEAVIVTIDVDGAAVVGNVVIVTIDVDGAAATEAKKDWASDSAAEAAGGSGVIEEPVLMA